MMGTVTDVLLEECQLVVNLCCDAVNVLILRPLRPF